MASIDELLAAILRWPAIEPVSVARSVIDAARAHLQDLEAAIQPVRRRIDDADAAVGQHVNVAEASLASLDARIAAGEARITQEVSRLESAITDHNAAFAEAQESRAAEAKAALEKSVGLYDESRSAAEARAAMTVADLTKLDEQATKLVKSVSESTITTEYGHYAQEQHNLASKWSVAAYATGLAAVGVAVVSLVLIAKGHQAAWHETVLKITASFGCLVVAGYAAKIASGHRDQERAMKRAQLAINALGPFLTGMAEGDAEEIRRDVALAIFKPAPQHVSDEPSMLMRSKDVDVPALVKAIAEHLGNR